jgi:hypothetical protein
VRLTRHAKNELCSFKCFDEQRQVDDDYCVVGFEKGRPVNVALLSPAQHLELLETAAERYGLDGTPSSPRRARLSRLPTGLWN